MSCLLNSRKLTVNPCCYCCKHCLYACNAYCTEDAYFCMLDVSSEDRSFVKEELLHYGVNTYDYSDRLIHIMGMSTGEPSLWDNPRYVEPYQCCQLYEKEEE